MHCLEYISEYLAAHADNELSPAQLRYAEEHIGACAACEARLSREHALKQMIRRSVRLKRAPAALRLRIRAALNDNTATEAPSVTFGRRSGSLARGGEANRAPSIADAAARRHRRSAIGIPLGLIGSLVMLLVLFSGRSIRPGVGTAEGGVPAFDTAIGKYLQFQHAFQPNVPPEAYDSADGPVYAWVEERSPIHRVADDSPDSADIARSYHDVNMPDDLFDLSSAGYHIAGGRVDHLRDGSLVTYTMYQGVEGEILSLCFSDATMAAPIGAVEWLGMRSFYTYKGYSICMSFYPTGHFVSILVSRMPAQQLLREVASIDTVAISQR